MGQRVYRAGSVEVDIGLQCVRRDGQVYHLRAQSFEALRYLIEHRGAIVGKEELVSRLWKGRAVTDNSLAQCMNDIRKALGDDPRQPRFLRTIPRSGYCFFSEVEESPQEPLVEDEVAAVVQPARSRTLRLLALCTGLAAIVIVAVFAFRLPEAPRRGELGWWRINEGAGDRIHDSSGHGLDGIVHGTARWVSGPRGPALQLEGVSTFLMGKDARSLPLGNAPRTITAWVRHAAAIADTTSIIHYGDQAAVPPRTFGLALDGHGQVDVVGPPPPQPASDAVRVSDDEWHFVAASYDGSLVRTFVDGREDRQWVSAKPLNTGASTGWTIGRYLTSGTPFRGAISDVRVFGRALGLLELQALQRCTSGKVDLKLPGGFYFFLPVFRDGAVIAGDGEISNGARDLGGVQLARSDGACSITSLRGADLGQNLHMSADLFVPTDGTHTTSAGLYFRSRRAAPGDGLIGGTSAGYTVDLESDGSVRVTRLNPHAVVAFRPPPATFDSTAFHTLEVDVQGEFVQVRLDHGMIAFQHGDKLVSSVPLPAEWEHSDPIGRNQGTAGVWFRTDSREIIGGQRARNFAIQFR